MSQVEIILDAEGIENQLEDLKEKFQLKLEHDREANENDLNSLADEKDSYTPEELRALLISDLKSAYGVNDAI